MRPNLRRQHEVRNAERAVNIGVPEQRRRAQQQEYADEQRRNARRPAAAPQQRPAPAAVRKAEHAGDDRRDQRHAAVQDRQHAAVRHKTRIVIKKEKHLDAAQRGPQQNADARHPERTFCLHLQFSNPNPAVRTVSGRNLYEFIIPYPGVYENTRKKFFARRKNSSKPS